MPEYTDVHGVEIVYDLATPVTTPRGVIHLLHGVGEHAGRYGAVIGALTDAGFIVYADDHRGHGRTGMRQHGSSERLGRLGPGGLRATIDAVWQLSEMARAEHPDLPFILLGHSWGSFIAQILVNRHSAAIDGLILSGSALRWPGSLNSGDLNAPWQGPNANGMEWLSTDPAVAEAFLADPLTTSTPLAKLFGPVDTLRLLGKPGRHLEHDVPTLIMVGREDTVGGPRSNHLLADAYRTRSGFTDVTTLVYPGARHEIFNEAQQAEVRADLLAWLDARFPVRD
ncbi:MAG TPA: lysophospholipase [Microbacterium sp.]|jgi:alpha-beta hydrolase superfamily lysophospholipase|uniref:alpha/beta fold hydrolase n=1 Tax=unclassified Microbacterium TaxID=2609290 RepID=UPI000E95FE12|nr:MULTISPECIES: alpha/beta fold hydrolase [unclassified Microbacterium]HAJ16599.1 lysophospholipase [Microbacterium sp.]HBU42625.1 lysophospholipase [Microbacterium sp.]|tara:strand:+ start:3454 stop:4302 length:849 start_codon:yes stop_codon:yes gene_type:complete